MKAFPRAAQWMMGLMILFIWGAVLAPVGTRARPNALRSRCQSHLKQIGLACLQYQQDYDGRFPPVSNGNKSGWADLIFPYFKDWSQFQCPAGKNPMGERSSDYFFNARLANALSVASPGNVVLFGDGFDNSGTNAHLLELPLNWGEEPESPGDRHLDGANFAFADGHVKWFQPNSIRGGEGGPIYSFAVKIPVPPFSKKAKK